MPATLASVAKVAKGVKIVLDRYPVTRGMVAYAILWPSGNILQQFMDGSRTNIDLMEALRYGVYGSCITAPILHKWIKVLSALIPGTRFKHGITKGYVDQIVFAPLNISQFYIGMSLFEGKGVEESLDEWAKKILPTWMISLSIWPIIQTINFTLVAEKNRVMAISLGSFLWMVFLSYMHHTKADELPEHLKSRRERVHYDYKHGQREAPPSPAGSAEAWRYIFNIAHCYSEEEDESAEKIPLLVQEYIKPCTNSEISTDGQICSTGILF